MNVRECALANTAQSRRADGCYLLRGVATESSAGSNSRGRRRQAQQRKVHERQQAHDHLMGRVGKLLRSLGKKDKGKGDKMGACQSAEARSAKASKKKGKASHVKPGTFSTWIFFHTAAGSHCEWSAFVRKKQHHNQQILTSFFFCTR